MVPRELVETFPSITAGPNPQVTAVGSHGLKLRMVITFLLLLRHALQMDRFAKMHGNRESCRDCVTVRLARTIGGHCVNILLESTLISPLELAVQECIIGRGHVLEHK